MCPIALDTGEMSIEDLVEDKELVIVMTEAQYVKAVPAGSFKTQGRGGRGVSGAKLKADDIVHHVIFTTAHAFLLFFSNRGKVYRLRAMDIPERERTAKGMPIVNLLPLQAGETHPGDHRHPRLRRRAQPVLRHAARASSRRRRSTSTTRRAATASSRSTCATTTSWCEVIETSGTDDIFMVARSGMTIRFNEDEVRAMGRTAGGVRGMKLRAGDEVVSVDVARDDTAILMITESGYGKRTQLDKFNTQGRGGMASSASSSPARRARSSPRSWSASTTRSSPCPAVASPSAWVSATSARRAATPPACG